MTHRNQHSQLQQRLRGHYTPVYYNDLLGRRPPGTQDASRRRHRQPHQLDFATMIRKYNLWQWNLRQSTARHTTRSF